MKMMKLSVLSYKGTPRKLRYHKKVQISDFLHKTKSITVIDIFNICKSREGETLTIRIRCIFILFKNY